MLSILRNDLRYAARSLSRTPAFAAAAIATIALGVGVNAGIFTILNGLLFRDLPAPDAHELVSIFQTVSGLPDGGAVTGGGTFSTAEYRAYRDRTQTLAGVLAISGGRYVTTLGGDDPQQISGALVSCNYFAVLRQPPALGRALTVEDCEAGAVPVVVLTHELWTTTFGADAEILGRLVDLNRQSFTVVGVASERTYGGFATRLGYFAPLSTEPLLGRNLYPPRYDDDRQLWLYLIGRRSAGVGLEQVRAELGVIAAQIDADRPGRATTLEIERATPLTVPRFIRGIAIGAAAVLMTAFGLILLIACANVANLLLARGTARVKEIGIRLSLGATRSRIVRQLLTESILIAFAGGALGSALGLTLFEPLVALALAAALPLGTSMPVLDLSPDFRVLWFAAALTIATSVLFGLAPALHLSKRDLDTIIKQDAVGAGRTRSGGRLRGVLVGVQVALCMALMIATGLLLRGLLATYTTDPSFEYRSVATVSLTLQAGRDADEVAAVRRRMTDAVAALPGVDAVASSLLTPLGTDERFTVHVRLPNHGEDERLEARLNLVTPGYFSLLEIPLVRGRTFTDAEIADDALSAYTRPAIVSETTARNLWPDGDPIGQTLLRGDLTLQVVGVAADARATSIGMIDPYYVYEPASGGQVLLVKSRMELGATASSIRGVVRSLDPTLGVQVLPLEAQLGWWRSVSGTVTALGASLGVLALVLAAIGIYGVVSYTATMRYREIGIRMALGASAPSVLGMMLRETMRPVAIGALLGIAGASALSRVLTSVLFGVSPVDPLGLGGGALLVLGVALASGAWAARRATRVDPAVTLRYE